jgi:hypothetical protein
MMAEDSEGRYYPDLMASAGPKEFRGLLWAWRKSLSWHPGSCGSWREGMLEDCNCRPPFKNLHQESERDKQERQRVIAHQRATEELKIAYGHKDG